MSPSNCIILNSATPCGPSFIGFPVLSNEYSSVAKFTVSMNRFAGELDDVNEAYQNDYGCSISSLPNPYAGFRYQVSMKCSAAVAEAIKAGCSVDSSAAKKISVTETPHLLCPAKCKSAVKAFETLLLDPHACPVSQGEEYVRVNRELFFEEMQHLCRTASAASCYQGTVSESNHCGWSDSDFAHAGCASNSTDTCCKKLLTETKSGTSPLYDKHDHDKNSTSTHSTGVHSSPNSHTSDPNSGTAYYDTSDKSSHPVLDPAANNGGAIQTPVWIPVFLTVLILFAVVPLVFYGYRKWVRRVSDNDHDGHEDHSHSAAKSDPEKTRVSFSAAKQVDMSSLYVDSHPSILGASLPPLAFVPPSRPPNRSSLLRHSRNINIGVEDLILPEIDIQKQSSRDTRNSWIKSTPQGRLQKPNPRPVSLLRESCRLSQLSILSSSSSRNSKIQDSTIFKDLASDPIKDYGLLDQIDPTDSSFVLVPPSLSAIEDEDIHAVDMDQS